LLLYFFIFIFKDFIYSFFERDTETETERAQAGGEAEGEGNAGSPPTREPHGGSILGPRDQDLSQEQTLNHLSHPGTLSWLIFV